MTLGLVFDWNGYRILEEFELPPMADDDVFEVSPETAGAAGLSTRAPVSLPAASGVDTRRGRLPSHYAI